MNKKLLCTAALLALSASAAQAQQAGSWLGRVGFTTITPQVSSGNLSAPSLPGTQIDVDEATQLSGGITYMLTNNWAVDLPLALPFKHEITGAGAIAGVGKLGDVRALPMTLLLQYRFMDANAQFRPYVGAGLTYAYFSKERSTGTLTAATGGLPTSPTLLSVKDKMGTTIQVGAVFKASERHFVDAMIAKTFLKTTNSLSTGQTIDTKLNPISVSVAIGMKF